MADKIVNQLVTKTVVEAKRDTYTPRDGEQVVIKKTDGNVYVRVGNGTTAGGIKPLIEDVTQLPTIPFSAIGTKPTTVAGYGITDGVTTTALQAALDNAVAGLNWNRPVRVATTANITLSAPQTIDGIAVVAGNRVLVKNQTTAGANGIYVVQAAAWARATDMDASAEFSSAVTTVAEGATQADTMWQVITDGVITVGTTAITWDQMHIKAVTGSADKLTTPRTITLTGDITGSTSFDGSANVSIAAVIADDSHNHTTANVDGLDTALAAKAPLASPALTGTPTVPTATAGTNTTQAASTAFVTAAVSTKEPVFDAIVASPII